MYVLCLFRPHAANEKSALRARAACFPDRHANVRSKDPMRLALRKHPKRHTRAVSLRWDSPHCESLAPRSVFSTIPTPAPLLELLRRNWYMLVSVTSRGLIRIGLGRSSPLRGALRASKTLTRFVEPGVPRLALWRTNKKTRLARVFLFEWRPQGDSNPCCRRERAVS